MGRLRMNQMIGIAGGLLLVLGVFLMTAVISIVAFGLIAYVGVIEKPGSPPSAISLRQGWIAALLGTTLIVVGAAKRSYETERPRRPPGTL